MIETEIQPATGPDLLLDWSRPDDTRRFASAGAASVCVHALLLAVLLNVSFEGRAPRQAAFLQPDVRKAVKLVAPRTFEPTQRAENRGPVARELDVRSLMAPPKSAGPVFRPPAPAPRPGDSSTQPVSVPEPPKIHASEPGIPLPGGLPPVAPPPVEKPKIVLENVHAYQPNAPSGSGVMPVPKQSTQEMARAAGRPGASGLSIGDLDEPSLPPGLNQPQAPGKMGSNLELLSDPRGADFKPYLVQVLTAVRRNWMSVIPESARFGRRGRVVIQFIIDREGGVPKLVIATPSGADALDRAAVASISASNPFPRLPNDYRGDSVRLQLVFSYNLQR